MQNNFTMILKWLLMRHQFPIKDITINFRIQDFESKKIYIHEMSRTLKALLDVKIQLESLDCE